MANKIPRTHHRRPGQKLSATILLVTSAALHTLLYAWATWVASTTATPPAQSLPLMLAAGAMALSSVYGAFRLNKLRRSAWRWGLRATLAGGAIMPLAALLPRVDMPDLGNTRWERHVFLFSLATATITIAWAARLLYVTRKHATPPPAEDAPASEALASTEANVSPEAAPTAHPPMWAMTGVLALLGVLHVLLVGWGCLMSSSSLLLYELPLLLGAMLMAIGCFAGILNLREAVGRWRKIVGLIMVGAALMPVLAFLPLFVITGCASMQWGFGGLFPSILTALITLFLGAVLFAFGRVKHSRP